MGQKSSLWSLSLRRSGRLQHVQGRGQGRACVSQLAGGGGAAVLKAGNTSGQRSRGTEGTDRVDVEDAEMGGKRLST